MKSDITFDKETLKYFQDLYQPGNKYKPRILNELAALWSIRLLLCNDAFNNIPEFLDNIYNEGLILLTTGMSEDFMLEESYSADGFRDVLISQLRTYKKLPIRIDPGMFSIFLSIKNNFDLSNDETTFFIFLLELEANEGLRDICNHHGEINIDETYRVLSQTLQINEITLREILGPSNNLDIYGLIHFNQEMPLTLLDRCNLLDVICLPMRNHIRDDKSGYVS